MKKFAQVLAEDRRLAILRFLEEVPDCSLNTSVIQSSLCAIGHSCSRDLVETDASWLEEQGLVACERIETITVCRLTARGADAARGLAVVPGVKKPLPRG